MTKQLPVAVSIRRLPSTSHWHRQLNSRRSRRIMDGLLQLLLDLLLVSWRNARMLVTGLRRRMSSGDYGKGEFSDVTISLKKATNVKTPHPMPSEIRIQIVYSRFRATEAWENMGCAPRWCHITRLLVFFQLFPHIRDFFILSNSA